LRVWSTTTPARRVSDSEVISILVYHKLIRGQRIPSLHECACKTIKLTTLSVQWMVREKGGLNYKPVQVKEENDENDEKNDDVTHPQEPSRAFYMRNWHDIAAYRHPLDSISQDRLINGACDGVERKGILGKIYLGDKRGDTETVSRDEQMVNGTAARIRKMQSVGMNKR